LQHTLKPDDIELGQAWVVHLVSSTENRSNRRHATEWQSSRQSADAALPGFSEAGEILGANQPAGLLAA
jgi:hypothetical protein